MYKLQKKTKKDVMDLVMLAHNDPASREQLMKEGDRACRILTGDRSIECILRLQTENGYVPTFDIISAPNCAIEILTCKGAYDLAAKERGLSPSSPIFDWQGLG